MPFQGILKDLLVSPVTTYLPFHLKIKWHILYETLLLVHHVDLNAYFPMFPQHKVYN